MIAREKYLLEKHHRFFGFLLWVVVWLSYRLDLQQDGRLQNKKGL